MRLTAPSQMVFLAAIVIAVVALLMFLGAINFAALSSFWLMTIAFVVLVAGNLLRGL